ncbi:hypothetical protein [Aeromonas veronii]|uniref:hypothetical protein n=1 Tax=Aeromonas veronii TaxID=654 RepID=UPI0024466EB6|nr:hypothetical protein [Aeromonas veronii]
MKFDKHGIEVDGDCIWLLDACGQRLCDLTEMQLLDFGGRISVEGGAAELRFGRSRVARTPDCLGP